jgi:hypothetical protein
MTPISWFFTFYPALVLALAVASCLWIAACPSLLSLASLPAVLYGLPLASYRLHELAFPLGPGASSLNGEAYSPWWGGHQIQWIYLAFPSLEAALRAVPGAFSLWLRLWGSTIGREVYWTPCIEISDRALLEIGDRVIFGHRAGLYPHLVSPTREEITLLVRRIRIGDRAFVGAGSVLGPGVVVAPDAVLPAGSQLRPGTRVEA